MWLSVARPVLASTMELCSEVSQCRNHSGAFLVDLPEAERLGEKAMAGVEVQGVEIDVGDLARPVRDILAVRVVGARAYKGEIAPVRIPATEGSRRRRRQAAPAR